MKEISFIIYIFTVQECFPSHKNHKMTTKSLRCSFHHSAISFLLCHPLSLFASKNIRFNRKEVGFKALLCESTFFMPFNHQGNFNDFLNTFTLFIMALWFLCNLQFSGNWFIFIYFKV